MLGERYFEALTAAGTTVHNNQFQLPNREWSSAPSARAGSASRTHVLQASQGPGPAHQPAPPVGPLSGYLGWPWATDV